MSAFDPRRLEENLRRVREQIASACGRAGRNPGSVRLVAVTKSAPPTAIAHLLAAGVVDLGESRVQQLEQRAQLLGAAPGGLNDAAPAGGPRWHMIGHLQRNKVKAVLRYTRIIHSIDSTRLADEIERHAAAMQTAVDVLVEVNVAGESSKSGLSPLEVAPLSGHVTRCTHLRLRGLMTMAPLSDDSEAARPHFAALRELLEALRTAGHVPPACEHLSMGMSQDFAVAIEEGATLVRVGSALFEGLDAS